MSGVYRPIRSDNQEYRACLVHPDGDRRAALASGVTDPLARGGVILMAKEKSTKYQLAGWPPTTISMASDQELEKWATDPNCLDSEACAKALAERLAKGDPALAAATRERHEAERRTAMASGREELQNNPFDPRTEVSADARHIAGRIVKHLWILFVLLPIVAVLLLALINAMK